MKSNLNSDFGYFNILINNGTDKSIEATFEETRISPILSRMQDWQLAVVRFKIPSVSVPLFIFEDDEVTGESPYWVSFSIGDNYTNPLGPVNIIWRSEFANNTETLRPYSRFIYYYSAFTQMVNRALLDLYTIAKADANYTPILNPGGDATIFPTAQYPFVELDKTTPYFKFFLPFNADQAAPSPFVRNTVPYINIHMSSKLYYFFSGFPSKLLSTPPAPNMDYALQFSRPILYDCIEDLYKWGTITSLPDRQALVVYQDYSCLYLWQTLTRLLFTTNIPVEQEYIGVSGSNGQNYQQVLLTDFEIEPTREGNQRDFIFYYADFPRYCNFSSNGDLRKMDLRIYFQTKDLQVFPLIIPPSFEVSVKIQFKRRKAYKDLQYSEYDDIRVKGSNLMNMRTYI